MIDPQETLKFTFVCTLSKMINAPEILKFRFSLHIVKDDWPPTPTWLPRIPPEILKFRFSLHMVKDDWPPHP